MKKILAAMLYIAFFALAACSKPAGQTDVVTVPTGGDSAAPQQTQSSASLGNSSSSTAAPSATDAPSADPNAYMGSDFNSCAAFYKNMTLALTTYVDVAVAGNNARIMAENPNGYESDPRYLQFIYSPFASGNMDFFATVGNTTEEVKETFEEIGFFDVEYDCNSKGEHRVSYKDEDETGRMTAIDERGAYENHSIRFERSVNGRIAEYYEFIWLGGNTYALQSISERAVIEYDGNMVKRFIHAQNRFGEIDEASGELYPWSIINDPATESIWGRTDMNDAWVVEKSANNGLLKLFGLEHGTLTVSGFDQNGMGDDVEFTAIEPVTITE